MTEEVQCQSEESVIVMRGRVHLSKDGRLCLIYNLTIIIKHSYIQYHPTTMRKLFATALQKIITEMQLPNNNRNELAKNIIKTYGNDVTYSKLVRLPLSEVKIMLKIPCPIIKQESREDNENQIAIFKRLRHNYNIDEESICFKCPRAASCNLKNIKYKQLQFTPKIGNKAALHDFLFFFLSLSAQENTALSQFRWAAAYKTTSSLLVLLKDFPILSQQSYLYRQVFKYLQSQEKKYNQSRKSPEILQKQKTISALKGRTIHLESKSNLVDQQKNNQ